MSSDRNVDADTSIDTGANVSADVPGSERERNASETDEPPVECAYCGRRFAEEDLLALHRGLEHADRLSNAERETFREAYAAEEVDLRLFRLKALLGLVVLYFGFLFAYSVFG